jgi:ParB family chromosome partitioning protein
MKKRIPLTQVMPNPDQPRKHFDPVKLRELAESIREHGLSQAITVRPVPKGQFMIVMGERRWRAHKLLAEEGALGETPKIMCEVRNMNDNEMDLQAIATGRPRSWRRTLGFNRGGSPTARRCSN